MTDAEFLNDFELPERPQRPELEAVCTCMHLSEICPVHYELPAVFRGNRKEQNDGHS